MIVNLSVFTAIRLANAPDMTSTGNNAPGAIALTSGKTATTAGWPGMTNAPPEGERRNKSQMPKRNDNTTRSSEGIEVYENNIYLFADEYINSLDDPYSINNNPSLFTGMIKYIYKYLFKPKKNDKVLNNTGTNLPLDNIQLLDDIWNIYTSLCYKYGKRPTVLNFCLMVGLDMATIETWKRGEYRSGGLGTSSPHSRTAQKWYQECESSLLDGATEKNSIGCIFALKANYGYREAAQQIEVIGQGTPQESREQIAAKYSQIAELPEPERPEL